MCYSRRAVHRQSRLGLARTADKAGGQVGGQRAGWSAKLRNGTEYVWLFGRMIETATRLSHRAGRLSAAVRACQVSRRRPASPAVRFSRRPVGPLPAVSAGSTMSKYTVSFRTDYAPGIGQNAAVCRLPDGEWLGAKGTPPPSSPRPSTMDTIQSVLVYTTLLTDWARGEGGGLNVPAAAAPLYAMCMGPCLCLGPPPRYLNMKSLSPGSHSPDREARSLVVPPVPPVLLPPSPPPAARRNQVQAILLGFRSRQSHSLYCTYIIHVPSELKCVYFVCALQLTTWVCT